jgi:hypothetical protein
MERQQFGGDGAAHLHLLVTDGGFRRCTTTGRPSGARRSRRTFPKTRPTPIDFPLPS